MSDFDSIMGGEFPEGIPAPGDMLGGSEGVVFAMFLAACQTVQVLDAWETLGVTAEQIPWWTGSIDGLMAWMAEHSEASQHDEARHTEMHALLREQGAIMLDALTAWMRAHDLKQVNPLVVLPGFGVVSITVTTDGSLGLA